MDDKFDLDELKNFDSSAFLGGEGEDTEIDSILRDFGENEEIEQTDGDRPSVEEFLAQKGGLRGAIADEIKKPDVVSVTGAFESIRAEKAEHSSLHFDLPERKPQKMPDMRLDLSSSPTPAPAAAPEPEDETSYEPVVDQTAGESNDDTQEVVVPDQQEKGDTKEIPAAVKGPDREDIDKTIDDIIKEEKLAEQLEKAQEDVKEETPQEEPEKEPEPEPVREEKRPKKTVGEITEEIPKSRFFNTETFEAIKEESREKHAPKNPIASFAMGTADDAEVEGEEIPPIEPTEEIDEYEAEDQREDITAELRRLNSSASFKAIFTFIVLCLSGAVFAALKTGFTFPGIDLAYDIALYVPILLGLSVAATVVNGASLLNGVRDAFSRKCSSELFLAVIFVLNAVLDVCYVIMRTPAAECVVFDFLYVMMLFFSILSKKMIIKNIYANFAIASSDGSKLIVDDRVKDELINDIIVDTGCVGDIAFASRSNMVTDFIRRSFDDFDVCSKFTSPGYTFLFLPLAAAIVNYVLIRNITTSLMFLTGAYCAVLPLLQGLSFALSLNGNGKCARKAGGVIVGASSCDMLSATQTLVADDADVFSVALNGIRFYGDATADKVILYLNSLYQVTGGSLKSLFAKMLSDDITSLPRIDDIFYHDNLGYTSLINSKVFAAGNKQLMEYLGIEIDDSDFEIIYKQQSKHVLFAAYDGKVIGVFVLSYSLSGGVRKALGILEKDQLFTVIAEHDQNVNHDTLFHHFPTDDQYLFKVLNFKNAQRCAEKFLPVKGASSLAVSRTGLHGLVRALHAGKAIRFSLGACRVIRIIASIIALLLITFLAFFSGITPMLPLHILLYHLMWCVPVLFVSFFSK